jgi:type II secretory pathway pseudopilin PulG
MIEMLGVLIVLSVLITMTVSVVGLVQSRARCHRAQADADALVQAVLHYREVYGDWPCDAARTNRAEVFVASVGTSNTALFAAAGQLGPLLQAADVDQASVLAALSPGSGTNDNPRGILFLTVSTNALAQGRLADPWGHPYLLVMDAQNMVFQFGDLAFSNLPAFAISAGPPVANPGVSNWIFSAGVRP